MRRVCDDRLFLAVWIMSRSVIIQQSFVGVEGRGWQEVAHAVADSMGLTLDSYCVGRTDDLLDLEQRWHTAYGITPRGVVLVRPDGFVA